MSPLREIAFDAIRASWVGVPLTFRFMMNAADACAMSTRAFMKSLYAEYQRIVRCISGTPNT
jgi:hypothetical protein